MTEISPISPLKDLSSHCKAKTIEYIFPFTKVLFSQKLCCKSVTARRGVPELISRTYKKIPFLKKSF